MDWLTICPTGATTPCIQPIQVAYLVGILAAIVLATAIARRTRDLTTATLSLMAVAIAINIAIGSLTVVLRLPIYLDSVGTVLVGALAGPWAGALTGLLSDLVWSLLPIPGGAGPNTAFFAPVAAVIGLMAGFWAGRGVFRLRSDDTRIGGFLALALGIGAAAVALLVVQNTVGLGFDPADQASQIRFVSLGLLIALTGAVVAWVSRRTIFDLREDDPRTWTYLVAATAISAAALLFAVLRLLFAPAGYFSTVTGLKPDGSPDSFLGGMNLRGLAISDPLGFVAAVGLAVALGAIAVTWARRGEHARLFPVWVGGFTTGLIASLIAAPIVAGLFGGVTGGGTDALVALFRTLGLSVFQSAFAQGLTSDPLDKTISYTIVFAVLTALPVTVRTMFSRGALTVAE
jgi:energy-coupling factor transport system substrate-specific component